MTPFPPNPPENPYAPRVHKRHPPKPLEQRAWDEGFVAADSWWRSRLASDETVEAVARALHVYEHGDEADYAPPDYQDAARAVLAALLSVAGRCACGLWELAFAAGRGAERERIVAALEADYRANVAAGADGIYTDGLHDAWRLTVNRAKRDDLIKPVSGSSEPRKETT